MSSSTSNDAESAQESPPQETTPTSALQENIDRKGKNAYYFAHAHKSTGPKWDGKKEPRLLSRQSSSNVATTSLSFDYSKSNITQYAFSDEGKCIKLYISVELNDQDEITLDYTPTSFCFIINCNPPKCLGIAKLSGLIDGASYKKKSNKVIVTLVKINPEVTWHTINDKGGADHGVV